MVRKLRSVKGRKKEQRIVYQYIHNNDGDGKPRKYTLVQNKTDRDLPENLIDFLLIKKQSNYQNENRVRLLRMNNQEDWDRLEKDFDSSEDEGENCINNFIWYHHDKDPDNYFTMATRCHDFFEKDTQILCCYGRRSNTYLMPAYGFCL